MTGVRRWQWSRARSGIEALALALLAYVPMLASPGTLSSDSKQYLYLDPTRFLARVPYLWDRSVGAGTVSHQHIGYLFPMGPYFWLADQLGISDRLAQRLWLGTITLLAALGVRWLLRTLGTGELGAFVAAVVYMFAPYQLAFTARISVLLLPWAALPWLVGFVVRGTTESSLRWPAAFALVAMTAGSVNASALLLALLAPAVVIVWRVATHGAWRPAVAFAWRSALLSVLTSLWWLAGLGVQGRYGLPVLQLTENVRTVSQFSSPSDILRGLGNWFFYGREPNTAYTLPQAAPYVEQRVVIVASFAVPALALFAALVTRWRYRALFLAFVVVGTIVGVGAYPYAHPSVYGRIWRSVAENRSLFTALRNTPRVGPVIILGCVALIAAGIGSLQRVDPTRRRSLAAAVIVVAIAFAAFAPVWRHGYFAPAVERPAEIPDYWTALAASLGRDPSTTRVLEVPGASFAIYRWGNTVEPVTPGLTGRPYLAREVLPYGTEGTVNLLDAFDRRMQLGTLEPRAIAPIARLFGAGTIVVRNDLAYDRLGGPRPQVVWAALTQPLAPGLEPPRPFGAPTTPIDRIDPASYAAATPRGAVPPVARFDVDGARPIVSSAATAGATVLVGDGDGIVDAAAAGLLDGRGVVLELAALSDAQLRAALQHDGRIVLTDSNRRRYRNFFSSIANTFGPTELAGQSLTDPNGYTYRPDLFARDGDDERSVVVQRGGTAVANRDGGSDRPEDRAAAAFDGDVRTAWRVNAIDTRGARVSLRPARSETLDSVTLVQALDWPRQRTITDARVIVNGRAIDVRLGDASLTTRGETVQFPQQVVRDLVVEIRGTSTPTVDPQFANPVGFAEIRLGTTRVEEALRLPVALGARAGPALDGRALAIELSRARIDPALLNRHDEELALDRLVPVPGPRTFSLTGTARVDPNAPDAQLDAVLGTTAQGVRLESSSHLQGDAQARASMAFDRDPRTAWTTAFAGQPGQYLDAQFDTAVTVSRVRFRVVTDTRHQIPTRVGIEIDGRRVATQDVQLPTDARDGASRVVSLAVAPTTARRVRLVIDEVRRAAYSPVDPLIPVAIPEVDLGVPITVPTGRVDSGCRRDLLRIDDRPVAIRLAAPDALGVRAVSSCGAAVTLGAGMHRVAAARGLDTGVDLDRLVLSSEAAGAAPTTRADAPNTTGPNTTGPSTTGPSTTAKVTVVGNGRDLASLRIASDGAPFWLVLGESVSAGWRPSSGDARFGPTAMINGYATGWLVTPRHAGTISAELRFEPQRTVWIAIAVSIVSIAGCVVALVLGRHDRAANVTNPPDLAAPRTAAGAIASWPTTAGAAIGALVLGAVFAAPWIGGVLAVSALVIARVPVSRAAVVVMAPLFVLLSRASVRVDWVWLSLGWVVLTVAVAGRSSPPVRSPVGPEDRRP